MRIDTPRRRHHIPRGVEQAHAPKGMLADAEQRLAEELQASRQEVYELRQARSDESAEVAETLLQKGRDAARHAELGIELRQELLTAQTEGRAALPSQRTASHARIGRSALDALH